MIGLSQLGPLLGVDLESGQPVPVLLWEAGRRLSEIESITLAIGAGSIAALVLLRRFYPRFPAPLPVVAAAAVAVYAFGLEGRGVGVVGEVPGSEYYSNPMVHDLALDPPPGRTTPEYTEQIAAACLGYLRSS